MPTPLAWSIPDKSKPKIKAKPLRTLPACFVTRPTKIPPILFVITGMNVSGVQLEKKVRGERMMVRPSVLSMREASRRMTDATFISMLNRYAFLGRRDTGGVLLRVPLFLNIDAPSCDPCKFFWVKAPAIPLMRLATKSGKTPCVTCLFVPSDEEASVIPLKAFCSPNAGALPRINAIIETMALGVKISSITSVDRMRIHSEITCVLDCRFPMIK